MQAGHVTNHGAGQAPHQTQQLYHQVQPLAHQILQVFLENQSEESTHAFTMFILWFRYQDGTYISNWMPPNSTDIVFKGRALEALAHWISAKAKELDDKVPWAQSHASFAQAQFQNYRRQLEQASYQSDASGVLSEFIYTIVINLLGPTCACLANALAGGLAHYEVSKETLFSVEFPALLLALLVRKLEEIQAKVSKVVMEMYMEARLMTEEESKLLLMQFFRYYTVQTATGSLEVHETCRDTVFQDSSFQVHLIDSFGCLMKLLIHLESMYANAQQNANANFVIGVDFEGVKLCRSGELCLVQMTCSDNPCRVYVLDVHCLGARAFNMTTPNGMSMKHIFEEQSIRKVWFDPRNDVDALFYQFGIMPEGVFDLQLAEVADRRNRNLNVSYVQGLQKCLANCNGLDSEQKTFAENINILGKQLFEPNNGGDYEIFRRRPLHPVILVYSAHDSRYMLLLYQQYLQALNTDWVQRVLAAGDERARWCLHSEYVLPSSEAPVF